MLSRKLDLNTIASTIEKVDMSRVKEVIPNSITKAATSVAKATKVPVSNEIGDVLNEYCDSKKVNKVTKDYLTNLDRTLQLNPGLDLCSAVKTNNPMDSILIKNAKTPTKPDFSGIVKQAVNTEMNKAGLVGSIPDCLFNGILNKISKLSDFGGLSLGMRLDLLSLIKDSCAREVVNGLTNAVMEQEATKTIINGLLETSPSKAYEYIAGKSKDNPEMVIGALESSLNDKEGKHTMEKLTAYNKLKTEHSGQVTTSGTVSDNILDNINSESDESAYFGDNFSVVENGVLNLGGVSSYGILKGMSNISNMAKDSLANKVSNDDMNSSNKTTDLSFASITVLANSFA